MKEKENDEIIDTPDVMKKPQEPSVIKEMILWWESKRLIYNFIIIGLSIFLIYDFWEYPMRTIKGETEIIINSIVFIIGANIFYTLGWGLGALGNFLYKTKGLNNTGRWIVFVIGTIFSIIWTDLHFVLEFDVLFAN